MGRPKAWLPFGDETLLRRVVRRVGEVASRVVVVAAPGQDVPALPDEVVVIRDPVEGRGPLEGILAGLDAVAPFADAAYVSSTDAPFVSPAVIRRLVALREGDDAGASRFDAVVPDEGGHYHALGALYAISVRPALRDLLDSGRLRASLLFEHVPTRFVPPEALLADPAVAAEDPRLDHFRNLNTPDDYAAALSDAGLAPPSA